MRLCALRSYMPRRFVPCRLVSRVLDVVIMLKRRRRRRAPSSTTIILPLHITIRSSLVKGEVELAEQLNYVLNSGLPGCRDRKGRGVREI